MYTKTEINNTMNNLSSYQLNHILTTITTQAKQVLESKLNRIILYGSYARGDYTKLSDVDIMIIANISDNERTVIWNMIYDAISDLDIEYNSVTSIHIQNTDVFNNWLNSLPFYQNVVREGVVLYAS